MYRLEPVLRTDLHSHWVEGEPAPAIVLWAARSTGEHQVAVTVDSHRYVLSIVRESSSGQYERELCDLGPDSRDVDDIEGEIAEQLAGFCRRLGEGTKAATSAESMYLSLANWAAHLQSPGVMNQAFKLYLDAVRARGEANPDELKRARVIAYDARKKSWLPLLYISLEQAAMVERGLASGEESGSRFSVVSLRSHLELAAKALSKVSSKVDVRVAASELARMDARWFLTDSPEQPTNDDFYDFTQLQRKLDSHRIYLRRLTCAAHDLVAASGLPEDRTDGIPGPLNILGTSSGRNPTVYLVIDVYSEYMVLLELDTDAFFENADAELVDQLNIDQLPEPQWRLGIWRDTEDGGKTTWYPTGVGLETPSADVVRVVTEKLEEMTSLVSQDQRQDVLLAIGAWGTVAGDVDQTLSAWRRVVENRTGMPILTQQDGICSWHLQSLASDDPRALELGELRLALGDPPP